MLHVCVRVCAHVFVQHRVVMPCILVAVQPQFRDSHCHARAMRAFLRTSSGEARDPASSVEHPAENSVPSSVEQPAETFSSIAAVNRWLTVQGAACNTPDFQKLRAAVSVLTKTPNPRQEEVCPLCSSWNVRTHDQRRRRPLATLIRELQQAVITEGSRFRASLDGQTGAPASSA